MFKKAKNEDSDDEGDDTIYSKKSLISQYEADEDELWEYSSLMGLADIILDI